MSVRILLGDCRARMAEMGDASADSVVSDPPYELGFMGKGWDSSGIAYDSAVWSEVFRVLKPGGHVVAFSGTRTYHRMAVAIEDAGFEIRDQLAWVYGSGFPKSLDISKALDKAAGAEREVVGPSTRRTSRGNQFADGASGFRGTDETAFITAPATEAAKQWQGWGTALKPAWEPICLARKPLVGTVVRNVLEHGVGGLNIDGCRVEGAPRATHGDFNRTGNMGGRVAMAGELGEGYESGTPSGRFPANLLHDGSDEVVAGFPDSDGRNGAVVRNRGSMGYGGSAAEAESAGYKDLGSAARFFYCAKTSKRERGEGNDHPTVKPRAVMAWLARLVTPPGGLVLDPFTGSGSTALAAMEEGFRFVGCELSPEYVAIAERRVAAFALELEERARSKVPDLFD